MTFAIMPLIVYVIGLNLRGMQKKSQSDDEDQAIKSVNPMMADDVAED